MAFVTSATRKKVRRQAKRMIEKCYQNSMTAEQRKAALDGFMSNFITFKKERHV